MFNDFGGLDELGDVQYDDHWDFGRLSSKIRYSSSAPKVLIEHSGVSLQPLKRFHLIVIYSSISSGNETAKADRVNINPANGGEVLPIEYTTTEQAFPKLIAF